MQDFSHQQYHARLRTSIPNLLYISTISTEIGSQKWTPWVRWPGSSQRPCQSPGFGKPCTGGTGWTTPQDLWVDSGTKWLSLIFCYSEVLLNSRDLQKIQQPKCFDFNHSSLRNTSNFSAKLAPTKKIIASSCGNWSHGRFQFRPILYLD